LALAIGVFFAAGDRPVSTRILPNPSAESAGRTSLDRAKITESFGKLPLSFEANLGQASPEADFIARGRNYTALLSSTGAQFTPRRAEKHGQGAAPSTGRQQRANASVRLKLLNAAPAPPEATGMMEGKSNYFIGNDPAAWRTDVPNYARVRYRGVYPGIDVVYYGNQRRMEYDFVVAPGSAPGQIRLAFAGADKVEVDAAGDLALEIDGERMRMRAPSLYQGAEGARRRVEGGYVLIEGESVKDAGAQPSRGADRNWVVGFRVGDYDVNKPLIIDPVLEYSTFYGGAGTDIAYGMAVDQQGSIYIAGQTSSLNFPTKDPFSGSVNGANDAFVAKLNPQGTAMVFSTYIGGRNPGDRCWAIAVDRAGNVYFTGETTSVNFPVAKAAEPNFHGGIDVFAAKLNIQGNVLLYSTYLGGGFIDIAYGIALDRFDNAYITGRTESPNFPIKNPYQRALRGQRDAFVTKLSPDGEILYSTFLGGDPATPGGPDEDTGYGIALDSLQNIYVTGYTTSPSFPVFKPMQRNFGGAEDAFVTKIDSTGSSLIYSTYLGGTRADDGRAIAVDGFGDAYVTGYTLSADFPSVNALQPTYGGSGDAFVAKLNGAGSALVYSTFLGGSGDENSGLVLDFTPSCAIAVDRLGQAYVTGKTASQDFPVVKPIQAGLMGDTDAFVAKIDTAGSALIFSTYLGSSFSGDSEYAERGLAVSATDAGAVYVTGQILKSDFLTVNPVQKSYGGGLSDAFIAKITTPDILSIAPVSAASFNGAALAPDSIVAAFGAGLASGTSTTSALPLPTVLLGTSVKVKDSAGVERSAPLFFVSPTQINFQIPSETAPGAATCAFASPLVLPPATAPTATVWINNVAPGLFSADASGQGLVAAIALRVRQDGSFNFEPVVQNDGAGRLIAVPIDFGPDLGAASDQVYLILFGTGIRNRSAIEKVSLQIGGTNLPALFAGPQGSFVGQDQVNALLPRTLAGRGATPVNLVVDGQLSNQLSVSFR
jgi:uncharacterized protein (TIGR03437 family)